MDRIREDSRKTAEPPSWMSKWKQSPSIRLVLCILFVLLFYFNFSPRLVPETYNIKLGQESDRDIVASKSIEDKAATEHAQDQAAQSVEPISSLLPLKPDSIINRIFNRIELLNQDEGISETNKIEIYKSEIPGYQDEYLDEFIRLGAGKPQLSESLLKEAGQVAKSQRYTVPAEIFYKIPSLNPNQIAEMRQVAVTVVRKLSLGADPRCIRFPGEGCGAGQCQLLDSADDTRDRAGAVADGAHAEQVLRQGCHGRSPHAGQGEHAAGP